MNKKKLLYCFIIIGLLIGLGFWLGRVTIKTETKTITKYIQLPPIHDTITTFNQVTEYLPSSIDTCSLLEYCINNGLYEWLIPTKEIEVIKYQSVDTVAILKDWLTKRNYDVTLFDNDTIGKLEVHPSLQYNKLQSLSYDFYPIQKQTEITKTKIKLVEPFIGLGIGTYPTYNCQVGLFTRTGVGFSYMYITDFKDIKSHNLNILYKF